MPLRIEQDVHLRVPLYRDHHLLGRLREVMRVGLHLNAPFTFPYTRISPHQQSVLDADEGVRNDEDEFVAEDVEAAGCVRASCTPMRTRESYGVHWSLSWSQCRSQ